MPGHRRKKHSPANNSTSLRNFWFLPLILPKLKEKALDQSSSTCKKKNFQVQSFFVNVKCINVVHNRIITLMLSQSVFKCQRKIQEQNKTNKKCERRNYFKSIELSEENYSRNTSILLYTIGNIYKDWTVFKTDR
jgi:hypothetical protein